MLMGFLAPIVGLVPAADVYGLTVTLVATASLLAVTTFRDRQ
jgi:hypothetical protein